MTRYTAQQMRIYAELLKLYDVPCGREIQLMLLQAATDLDASHVEQARPVSDDNRREFA